MQIDGTGELNIEPSCPTDLLVSSSSRKTECVETDEHVVVDNEVEENTPPETLEKSDTAVETEVESGATIIKEREYKLSGVVCQIHDGANQRHLVSLAYVANSYHEMKQFEVNDPSASGQWYIFNDFSIAPVSVQEAVWFTLDWKVPCVLFYSSSELLDSTEHAMPPVDRTKLTPDQLVNPFVHVSNLFLYPICPKYSESRERIFSIISGKF